MAEGIEAIPNENNSTRYSLEVMRGREMVRAEPESGVDMAFDALMDLEENSDLSTFMKTFLEEGAETAVELWTSLDETTVATNSATQRVLRCSIPSKIFTSKLNLHLFRDKTLYQTTTTGKKSSSP